MRTPLLALCLGLVACRGEQQLKAVESRQGASATSPGVDEMCAEHGVLKAVCTRCNPALVPVFQAKGDWCGEHGLPESMCPVCHPERGGRPARAITPDDGSPPDGTLVRLKGERTAAWAGLKTVKAVARPGSTGTFATATVIYDAMRIARINARAAGVVQSLNVDIGSRVKALAPLAIIESPTVGADRSRLGAARAGVAIAEEHLRREEQLASQQLTTRLEVLAAQRELQTAKAEEASLAAALSVIGASKGKTGGYAIATPLSGVVVRRNVSIGQLVHTEETLFEVVDTSVMWAEIDVPEHALSETSVGQQVVLRFDALRDRQFEGQISSISPEISSQTRTAKARVRLDNADGSLRANLFGEARMLGAARERVMVPYQAVQRARAVQLVFVKQAEGQYEARRVALGASEGDWIELLKGVKVGDEVVTEGSFLLKTETLKDSIGAGCCEAD